MTSVRQQIIWTALPNGLQGEGAARKVKLSVFMSPRLSFDVAGHSGDLASFPDFLDWPRRLLDGSVTFTALVSAASPMRCEIKTRPQPELALWTALFGRTTLVRGYTTT